MPRRTALVVPVPRPPVYYANELAITVAEEPGGRCTARLSIPFSY